MEFQADELDSLESSFPYKDFYTGAYVVSEQRKTEGKVTSRWLPILL